MKKRLFLLLAILAFACATPSTSLPAEAVAAGLDEPQRKELIVYITDTGAKDHRAGCRHLRHSKHPISITQAQQRGYDACKVCKSAR